MREGQWARTTSLPSRFRLIFLGGILFLSFISQGLGKIVFITEKESEGDERADEADTGRISTAQGGRSAEDNEETSKLTGREGSMTSGHVNRRRDEKGPEIEEMPGGKARVLTGEGRRDDRSTAYQRKEIERALETLPDLINDIEDFGGDAVDSLKGGDLDPGGWKFVVEMNRREALASAEEGNSEGLYIVGLQALIGTPSAGKNVSSGLRLLEQAASKGNPHAQSALGFVHSNGYGVEPNDARAFVFHSFAAEGGSYQSKMALAYGYLRQQEPELAAKLYAEVAAKSIAVNRIPGEAPLVETVRLYTGGEENPEAVRGYRGEDDEAIQFLEYNARKGSIEHMRILGNFYFWGARGLGRDHARAFDYFKKAAELGDPTSMVNLGEMFARGVGVGQNYDLSLKWFRTAAEHKQVAALNGLGYMAAKGRGVPQNFTKALEHFTAAATPESNGKYDADARYNLGVLHLHGMGVKRSPAKAFKFFEQAARLDHLGAIYQLARAAYHGVGTTRDFNRAAVFYKMVAERGPWGGVLRWAHASYMSGDIATSFLLYSRLAELGYEVAQSNAAWLLDKWQVDSGCAGAGTGNLAGLQPGASCTAKERDVRAHRHWRHASEQGNVQAALLIGDAYFYGKGTRKDLERASEAYLRAAKQRNHHGPAAQAMFNLGYMHEHGLGLPLDRHLAKRYYDDALSVDPDAALPVKLALIGLWMRQRHSTRHLMKLVDSLPQTLPKLATSANTILWDEGNMVVATLFVLLLTVLYLRQRQQRLQNPNPPVL